MQTQTQKTVKTETPSVTATGDATKTLNRPDIAAVVAKTDKISASDIVRNARAKIDAASSPEEKRRLMKEALAALLDGDCVC